MKSSMHVKRQSFEIRLNSVISFVFVAFCPLIRAIRGRAAGQGIVS